MNWEGALITPAQIKGLPEDIYTHLIQMKLFFHSTPPMIYYLQLQLHYLTAINQHEYEKVIDYFDQIKQYELKTNVSDDKCREYFRYFGYNYDSKDTKNVFVLIKYFDPISHLLTKVIMIIDLVEMECKLLAHRQEISKLRSCYITLKEIETFYAQKLENLLFAKQDVPIPKMIPKLKEKSKQEKKQIH